MIANILLMIAGYLGVGVVAAVALHAKGVRVIDSGVEGAGWFFRALITPGLVALWPLMLFRWGQARQAGELIVGPENVVSARALRRAHGAWIQLLAVLIPVAAGAALATRRAPVPPEPQIAKYAQAEPKPLSHVVEEWPGLFGEDWPIDAVLRSDGQSARQLELIIRGPLPAPALALYWEPLGNKERDGLNIYRPSVFLGSLAGPGRRRYALPAEAAPEKLGNFSIHSLGHGEKVASSAPQ